jgi:hypothetical protein
MEVTSLAIHREIKTTKDYLLAVGQVPGDKVPQYLILNRHYDVLEFAHNVLSYALEAMDELQDKLDGYNDSDDEDDDEAKKPPKKKKVVN